MANDGTDVTSGRGPNKIQRWFLTESGGEEKVARASLDVTHVGFSFADGSSSVLDLKDVFGGTYPPVGVGRAAAAFGINTSAGNAANTAEDKTPAGLKEAVDSRLDTFLSDGRWTQERAEGGPRSSIFFDALFAYRQTKGADVSEAKQAELRQKFAEPEQKKAALNNADFKVFYIEFKAARDKAAAKSAEGAAPTESLLG